MFGRTLWMYAIATVTAVALLVGLAGCNGGGSSSTGGMILAQAQFPEGNSPGAAKLSLLRPPAKGEEEWSEEVITDSESNVFHKALVFEHGGAKGILTIGAMEAKLVFWKRDGEAWTGETLWKGKFGGKFDRLRDIEIGDVTGDGEADVVVATHDQGVILVFERKGAELVAHEIDRKADTFVHEIELGDVDGDGTLEIFATPSARNVSGTEKQPGDIVMFRHTGDVKFDKTALEHFETRHVKEILWYAMNDGDRTLFAAVEGEGAMAGGGGATSLVRVYRWKDGAFAGEDVTTFPGKLCRFLNGGDTDGDGEREIIASTGYKGVYKIWSADGGWKRKKIVPESVSTGFEHATILLDQDGDGRDDLLIASDNQNQVNRFFWDPKKKKYDRELLRAMKLDFTWNITPLPEGW